jgi:hypothetical protein
MLTTYEVDGRDVLLFKGMGEKCAGDSRSPYKIQDNLSAAVRLHQRKQTEKAQ